ncbi:beta-1,6-N-acetylglucosaminyltransferase [Paenibacillus sp. NPDC057934]|uniref:beta-1,6-N-acetylglucosaminyltransferase n=1 Tax=Paenibacillus sp. NPDC057934 TaxID=3346282 RepID=UPI0036D97F33
MIAYFILAHQKPTMLQRLLSAIYDPNNLYLIHVDLKAKDLIEFAHQISKNYDNIRIMPSRHITYASWSMVQVELDAIKELLYWSSDWTHFINLSGQDMPLVNQDKVKNFLKENPNKNFINLEIASESDRRIHFNGYFIEDCGYLKRLGERNPFESYFDSGIKAYRGSQWKMITREFAEYVIASSLSFEMQDYFKFVLIPDETFFPTLIMNSNEFVGTVVNNNLRYIVYERKETGFSSAAELTMKDIISIYSSDVLFARKFDDAIDSSVIDLIESTL